MLLRMKCSRTPNLCNERLPQHGAELLVSGPFPHSSGDSPLEGYFESQMQTQNLGEHGGGSRNWPGFQASQGYTESSLPLSFDHIHPTFY